MNRQGVSRRTLTASILMLVVALCVVGGFSLLGGGSEPAKGSEPQVLLLVGGDLGAFSESDSIATASRLGSLEEARTIAESSPALVVVDSSFANNLKSGDLRSLVASGSAVIGLDIPLSQLNDLTGFEEELRALNPKFATGLPAHPKPSVPFYSLVWRTPQGADPAYWGRLQHSWSDGLFEVILRDYKLRVRGLISDGDQVVPLEDYGRE